MDYKKALEDLISDVEKYSDEDNNLIQLRGGLYALIVKIESSPKYKKQLTNIRMVK